MHTNAAVSPVIGVLLMLTLTLVVAAIVNSYAGGLFDTEPKAPTVTLLASFHQIYNNNNSLDLRHISGDPLPTSSIKILLRPSETFGAGALQQISQIDKSYITNISDTTLSWGNGISVFSPGDMAIISSEHANNTQVNVEKKYWITNQSNQGKTFFLEIYYKNSMISRNEVLIEQ